MTSVKCVVVGDGMVGKTCLLQSFATNEFPHDHVPTIFDSFSKHVTARSGRQVNLLLWDTAGQEDYDRLRPLCYPETEVFVVCFSLVSPASAENVLTKWGPELTHHLGLSFSVPLLLVGTKLDLRDDETTLRALAAKGGKPLGYADGLRLAKDLSAKCDVHSVEYFECSALTQRGLHAVFDRAVELATNPGARKRKSRGGGHQRCVLL
mmetsp:Transcript_6608/g.17001  ORF Transcript_6608/g.17001 Transcript_6608/m.17001 type:complete len:208 (-) Transcript_6608:234-857(-)